MHYFQSLPDVFKSALKEHIKQHTFIKTADLKVGKVYKFKKMKACLEGKYGAMLSIFLKDGQYTLPSKLGKIILSHYQKKNMAEQLAQLVSEDGLKSTEAVYLKLNSIGGTNNNSPNFTMLTSKEGEKAVILQGENSEEEDDDDDDEIDTHIIIHDDDNEDLHNVMF